MKRTGWPEQAPVNSVLWKSMKCKTKVQEKTHPGGLMIILFAACKSLFIPPLLLYPAPLLQGWTEGWARRYGSGLSANPCQVSRCLAEAVWGCASYYRYSRYYFWAQAGGGQRGGNVTFFATHLHMPYPCGAAKPIVELFSFFIYFFYFCVDCLEVADRGLVRQQVQVQHSSLDDLFGPDNI